MSTTPIVQFGTSRFLQAHADLFIWEAMANSNALGPITVVQSSGDASRSKRLNALGDPDGYEVQIKGIADGQLVESSQRVKSINRTLSLPQDLDQVADIITSQAKIILSNTADAGFRPSTADASAKYTNDMSYPAKLTWFLHQRFQSNGTPIQVMPAELIQKNGEVLRDLVFDIARIYSPDFQNWLRSKVTWVNSLVDRIVSTPLEPAGAVAEPYALWAIEDQDGLVLPCTHPNVKVVHDLAEIETLKLFILNLGHTYLVHRWLQKGDRTNQYVRELMEIPDYLNDLTAVYHEEVVPAFAAQERRAEAEAYVATTLDRFKNPFLDHRLADIAQNHAEKVSRRIKGFLDWANASAKPLNLQRLEAIVKTKTMVELV